MKPFSSTYVTVIGLIRDFIVTNFPAISVQYPETEALDYENLEEFLVVEVGFNPVPRTLPGNSSYDVMGEIFITHHRRENRGRLGFINFTDEFFDNFSMQTKSGITFYTVKPYQKQGLPGFDGTLNVVTFSIDKFS